MVVVDTARGGGPFGPAAVGPSASRPGREEADRGTAGVIFGGGFLAAGIIVVLMGLDVQTYQRLTYERPVAMLELTPGRAGTRDFDRRRCSQADGQGAAAQPAQDAYELYGDEWRIEARVLEWKPWANVLGLQTAQYPPLNVGSPADTLTPRPSSTPNAASMS